uniref:Uncharacterized protein n=1 Tax=Naja naja TaxID=35670 RepID=A0A8C6X5P6_NAJNA
MLNFELVIWKEVRSLTGSKNRGNKGRIWINNGNTARGIGRLIAFEFAKQRSRLVLWDINKVRQLFYFKIIPMEIQYAFS